MPDLCPHCGQALPQGGERLTPREMDVLVSWWMEGTVKQAAAREGITEQRAKNLLSQARIRNQVNRNDRLLALHFADVLSAVKARSATKREETEAA